MSKTTASRISIVTLLAFVAGSAWAESGKLDEAQKSTAAAIALLQDIQGEKGEAHRKKAIELLRRAQGEILKAKGE
jgi:hypothetical protein